MMRSDGELQAAMESFARALDIKQRVLGWRHVEVAQLLAQMADVARQQDKLDKALGLYARAWPVLQESLGENHAEVGAVLSSLGIVQEQLGLTAQPEAATGEEERDHRQPK